MLHFKLVYRYVVNNFVLLYFVCNSCNLIGKWNLDIDFFQVLTYYNFPNFDLVEKCYRDNK